MTAGERIKTGAQYISQLLPPVIDVLERNGWQVPKLTNQKYNQLLKTIGTQLALKGCTRTWRGIPCDVLVKDTRIRVCAKDVRDIRVSRLRSVMPKVLAKGCTHDFDRVGMTLDG